MSEDASFTKAPQFLTAGTPQGLRRQMLLMNSKMQTQIHYHSIQFVSGKWYAWFYQDQDLQEVYNTLSKGEIDE